MSMTGMEFSYLGSNFQWNSAQSFLGTDHALSFPTFLNSKYFTKPFASPENQEEGDNLIKYSSCSLTFGHWKPKKGRDQKMKDKIKVMIIKIRTTCFFFSFKHV